MTRLAHVAVLGLLAWCLSTTAAQATDKLWTGPSPEPAPTGMAEMGVMERPKSTSDGLVLSGTVSYQRAGSIVTLSADGVYNNSTRSSGTVRLELWATTFRPSPGVPFSGYRLAVSPTLPSLAPGSHYSNVGYAVSFIEPPPGTYWMVFALDEFNYCSTNDGFCLEDSAIFNNQQIFGLAVPPQAGPSAKSFGSRGTVSSSARMYGAFELASPGTVYIVVRGNSLGTLGVTQAYLDAPRLQLFDAQGTNLISQGGLPGVNSCLASNTVTDLPVVNYYAQVRGEAVSDRDACYATTLPAGVYTFSVNPSILGATSNETSSSPSAGEVLFEATIIH